jgi:sugar (pentulose or hexulose) kinase
MTHVAVFDVGKTNAKLSVTHRDGGLLETLSIGSPSRPGPPYRHHDLERLEEWLCEPAK